MSVDIDVAEVSRIKRYSMDGCYPKMSAETVFLSAAMIGILNSFASLELSGHRVDQDNQRIYVLMSGNKLAVIGMSDGFPYEVARLTTTELQSLTQEEFEETPQE